MANLDNILEDLVADGRLLICPFTTYTAPTVLTVNLDNLAARLTFWCRKVYSFYQPLSSHYCDTAMDITSAVSSDIEHMGTYALWCCYNRLRSVAARYSPATWTARMNPRAPCSNSMEFPSFISSLL
ncbi:hypothetical protein CDL15_Pgr009231 [Punica granatum]|uniref:Uncharacterized protein n=1 Tax=Punica granatum TaxID=22663 RepID=A0A218WVN2_PUNGR|nr:hypothetical protein CDL15_Pgr009231 [Punica granatum]